MMLAAGLLLAAGGAVVLASAAVGVALGMFARAHADPWELDA